MIQPENIGNTEPSLQSVLLSRMGENEHTEKWALTVFGSGDRLTAVTWKKQSLLMEYPEGGAQRGWWKRACQHVRRDYLRWNDHPK